MTTEEARRQPGDPTTDYDVLDPNYIKNPFPVWDEIREKCPIAHTERWGGSWMPTKYEDLFKIAQDWKHFSSQDVLVVPPQLAAGSAYLDDNGEFQGEFPGVAAPPIGGVGAGAGRGGRRAPPDPPPSEQSRPGDMGGSFAVRVMVQ